VKDTPVLWTTVPFAGDRQNEDLGRSSTVGGRFPPPSTDAPVTSGVLWNAKEGNAVGMRLNAHAPTSRGHSAHSGSGDDVLHSVQRPVHVGRHTTPRRKPSEVTRSNRHRGRASLRKQERTGTGAFAKRIVCGSPLANRSRKGESVAGSEKEGGHGLPPCEDRELRFGCSHVGSQLQKSVGDVRPRIRSKPRPKKGDQGRVNGGLALRGRRRDERRRVRGAKRRIASRPVIGHHGAGPAKGPGWRESVIQRLPQRPKGGGVVAGPGL
jgi:hypothetical protein